MSRRIVVKESQHGLGVFAETRRIPAGVEVTRFEGKIVLLEEMPPELANYVVRVDRDHCMVPEATAMYLNHSCNPNCEINDDYAIITRRIVQPGEQLFIAYNQITAEEARLWGDAWDDRWTFNCGCGHPACVGRVDRYVILSDPPTN